MNRNSAKKLLKSLIFNKYALVSRLYGNNPIIIRKVRQDKQKNELKQ